MAHRYRPQPHAPGRRAALHGAEPESWTSFLFCIDAIPSPSSISDLLPTLPRFEGHPVCLDRLPGSNIPQPSLPMPMSINGVTDPAVNR